MQYERGDPFDPDLLRTNARPSRQSSLASSCISTDDDMDSKIGTVGRKRGSPEDVWICGMCTAENPESLGFLCQVCGTRKCRVERRDSLSSVGASSTNSFSLDELLASDCFEYDGPDDDAAAPQQHEYEDSMRQDSVSNESALRLRMGHWSLQDRDEWKCAMCTFVNKPLFLQCEMCGQARLPLVVKQQTEAIETAAEETDPPQQQKPPPMLDVTIRAEQAARLQEVARPKEKRRATSPGPFGRAAAAAAAASGPPRRATSPVPPAAAAGMAARRSRSPLPPSGRAPGRSRSPKPPLTGVARRSLSPPAPPGTGRPRLSSNEFSMRTLDLSGGGGSSSLHKPQRQQRLGDSQATETTFDMSSATFAYFPDQYYNNSNAGHASTSMAVRHYYGEDDSNGSTHYYQDQSEASSEASFGSEHHHHQHQRRMKMPLSKTMEEPTTTTTKTSTTTPSTAATSGTKSTGPVYGDSADC